MAETKIEWADYTFNPWIGCTKVSAGCQHCYAETQNNHYRWNPAGWGPDSDRHVTSVANWAKLLAWNRAANSEGTRRRVFCASLADVFDSHESIAWGWRRELFCLIEQCRHLDWLLLTKRPENVNRMIQDATGRHAHAWLADCNHVWIGATMENQEAVEKRMEHLLAVPAARRFISCEPLLGPIEIYDYLREKWYRRGVDIDWVICGGESGSDARPMHPDWVRKLKVECGVSFTSFFFKQWGEWLFEDQLQSSGFTELPKVKEHRTVGGFTYYRVGKKRAGRLLDGLEWNAVPDFQPVTPPLPLRENYRDSAMFCDTDDAVSGARKWEPAKSAMEY